MGADARGSCTCGTATCRSISRTAKLSRRPWSTATVTMRWRVSPVRSATPRPPSRSRGAPTGWKRLFDPTTRVVRGKDSQGRWREPFDPLRATSPLNNPGDYTEANAWQYTATPALHDPLGFRDVLGRAAGPGGLARHVLLVADAEPGQAPRPGSDDRPVRARQRAEPSHRLAVRVHGLRPRRANG